MQQLRSSADRRSRLPIIVDYRDRDFNSLPQLILFAKSSGSRMRFLFRVADQYKSLSLAKNEQVRQYGKPRKVYRRIV
jgi:hypothetical protein